jgi:hypothetical protein
VASNASRRASGTGAPWPLYPPANWTPLASASLRHRVVVLPNGGNYDREFDSAGRVTIKAFKNSIGTPLSAHWHSYNAGGQRIHSDYVDYTYDAAGQIKTMIGVEGPVSRWHE